MTRARDLADLGGSANAGTVTGDSLIINGDMAVSQRGTSFSFAHDGTTVAHTLDRFRFVDFAAGSHDCTVAQVSDSPSGFSNSVKVTTGTAESAIDATEIVYLDTKIEAQNLQHLNYGTSSAKKLTLSFWVKSSVTGTYGVNLYKPDTTSRIINGTYTIDTASTWEYKTITFDGDTDSGATIDDDNGAGLWVSWHLASGSDYDSTDSSDWIDYVNATWAYGHAQDGVITTAGATWQLTGAKLEVGSVATPYRHESYAENLAKCQRYYEILSKGGSDIVACGLQYSGSLSVTAVPHKVVKRAVPTAVITGSYRVYSNGGNTLASTVLYDSDSNEIVARLDFTASRTAGHAIFVRSVSSSGVIAMDAEL